LEIHNQSKELDMTPNDLEQTLAALERAVIPNADGHAAFVRLLAYVAHLEQWKTAVIEAAVVHATYAKEHEDNPRLAVGALAAGVTTVELNLAKDEIERLQQDNAALRVLCHKLETDISDLSELADCKETLREVGNLNALGGVEAIDELVAGPAFRLTRKLREATRRTRACCVCGCTEDRACSGGCSWVVDPEGRDLCSQCIGKPVPVDARMPRKSR